MVGIKSIQFSYLSPLSSIWLQTKSHLRRSDWRGATRSDTVHMLEQKWRHRLSCDFSPYFFPCTFFPLLFFPRTFFPMLFSCTFFPYNFHRTFPVLIFPYSPPPVPFFQYYFPVFFFHPLFLVVVQNVGWGCSLRCPRTIRHYHPFYFNILGVLYDVRVL